MNREIKFRAWCSHTGMVNIMENSSIVLEYNKISGWNIVANKSGYSGEYLLGDSQSETSDFRLMQYTGLKDKNEKDIYEGDILANQNIVGEDNIYVCEYVSKEAIYVFCSPIDGETLEGNADAEDMVIIGNIYENPELLNK